jgi:hypothetical protein
MARRLVRFPGGDEVEIVGYQRFGEWVFRNPRSGAWQWSDANVPAPLRFGPDAPARHRGPIGGPTDAELASPGEFNIRYHIDGRDYYSTEYHPGGVAGQADRLRADFEAPEPRPRTKSPRPGEPRMIAA